MYTPVEHDKRFILAEMGDAQIFKRNNMRLMLF